MPSILYRGRTCEVRDGQTVLDALLAAGEPISYACRAGACGACVLRATAGEVPPEAQLGLRDAWKARGCFHACQCRPYADLTVEPIGEGMRVPARVESRSMLSPTVARVVVRLDAPFDAAPGQYVTVQRAGVARSFSIAARAERTIELHVRRVLGGKLSPYLCDEALPGDALDVQGPFGYCLYAVGRPEQPLLLAGTGTGLAPLWGVLHDALAAGHAGPIHVVHGAVDPSGLYLVDELRALSAAHPAVRYVPSVLRGALPGMEEGSLDEVVLRHVPRPAGARIFVCGAPDIVQLLKKRLFLAGASLREILSDAFVPAAS
ncbi:MAG: 2Fe-2S iron-sulfur cluster-binding protein [Polyangiaceae bacterium]